MIFTALPEIESDGLASAVRTLVARHLPLVVVLDDPALRAAAGRRPSSRAELAAVLVARDVVSAREQTLREARRLGALVVQAAPGESGAVAMNAYIDVKRRQLL